MDKVYRAWKQGECPSQHLWGMIELEKTKKIELIILKHQKYKFLDAIGNLFKISHLDQQVRILLMRKKIDIIYAPYATSNTKLLLMLKLFKLISIPIVVAVHQPMFGFDSGTLFTRFIAKHLVPRYDAMVFLSHELKLNFIKQLSISKGVANDKFFEAEWGADPEFYGQYSILKKPLQTNFIICAGRTDRDFDVIIEAFREIDFPLKIYCDNQSAPQDKNLPKNISIYNKNIKYIDLLKEYNNSRIILIPLKRHRGGTQGLTSLIDVYAMGKPVIMTYNKSINIDIETEGAGYWIEQDNMLAWREKITKILNDDRLYEEKCANSRKIYKERSNTEIFAKSLESVFNKVYTRN